MPDSQLFDIILVAAVAGVILFRLYTVLGRRTGHERQRAPNPGESVVPLPERAVANPNRRRRRRAIRFRVAFSTSSWPTRLSRPTISSSGARKPMR